MEHPKPPLISVVMPVYNGADLLPRAVASLRAQTFRRWEALVVDDASTDQSATVADALAADEPRVRVFRSPANGGPSAARNLALSHARGEWVAYLDHDDEYYPDYLAHLDQRRGEGDVLVFRYDLTEERPGRTDTGRTRTYDPAAHYEHLPTCHVAVPLGFAHRRALVARFGGFDESLRRDEDAELIQRYARLGATFTFVPERSGRYHVRSDSQSRTTPPAPPPPVARQPAPAPLPPRPPGSPRVMFASYHRFGDTSSGASLCTRDLFDLLAPRGWSCGAFTGPLRDAPAPQGPPAPGESVARGWHGRLTFAVTTSTAGGYPVSVFQPDPADDRRKASPPEAAAFAHLLGEAARAFRPDVVLTYGGDPASRAVPRAAKEVGARVVFWLHNFAYPDRDCFAGCDAVVVPSAFSRDRHRERLGIEAVALPPPLGVDRVVAPRADGGRYVTFVNPEPAKGVYAFARLAEVLGRTRPDIPLLLVEGRGGVNWLEKCGVDLRGVSSLHRMPNTADPRRFYRLSRLVLMPSVWWESFGRVAAEAMLNGIPVVASDRGALPEVVGDGGVCLPLPDWLTPDTRMPPTETEMAPWVEAVTCLWDDPAAYAQASAAARASAERQWHPGVLAPRWADFLNALVAAGSP